MSSRYLPVVLGTLAIFGFPWWLVASHILVVVASFILGLSLGYTLADGADLVTQPRLKKVIAMIVTLLWSISVLADILLPGYATPILLYAIMGAVAGYFFSEDGFTVNIGEHQ